MKRGRIEAPRTLCPLPVPLEAAPSLRALPLRAGLAPLLLLAPLGSAAAQTAGPITTVGGASQVPRILSAPYRELTNNLNEVANFNVEPHRGMVLRDDLEVWALNVHGSVLHSYFLADPAPTASYPTLLNPVSVATWEDQILVLGSGTHALALHDRLSGDILSILDLPSEPFALEVDEHRDTAWITCQGTDQLVEVDLLAWRIDRTFDIPGERAAWITLHNFENDFDGDDEVWVSPEISGNNTLVAGTVPGTAIINGEDTSLFPNGGLPDADLTRIDITTGALTVIGRDVNTIQFAHRTNPVTGATWHLGAESFNLAFQSEDDHKGRFQSNRISITDYGAAATLPATPDQVVVLDVVDSELNGNPKTVSHPRDIAFFPPTGGAWVASQTGDFVAAFDFDGSRIPALDFPLPDGSIPSQVLLDSSASFLLVYSWGTNKIHVISLVAGSFYQIVVTYDLGHDPTPEAVKRGREIFYDADRSENDQTTCGSCHPGGASDSLAWNIQDNPTDPKEVMVTQTLYGIEDNFPHHWRGERNLREFNAAFAGLLGGPLLDETAGGELDQFVAFVNSLTPFANPNQHVSRRLVDSQTDAPLENGAIGSAVTGQDIFFDEISDGAATCATCHAGPTGSSGDPVSETGSFNPHVNRMEIMQLDNQIDLKDQDVVTVDVTDPGGGAPIPFSIQELGSGWAHNGVIRSLQGFLEVFGQLDAQQQADGTTYMKQFDTGISRAAHQVYPLNQDSRPAISGNIRTHLIGQARQGWVDVIAFGESNQGGARRDVSWVYDASSQAFVPDDPTLSARPFSWFVAQARVGDADMVFLGVPPGNGERLGIDWDNDGLRNVEEIALGLLPRNPDFDGDGFKDGYEQLHSSDPMDAMSTPTESAGPVLRAAREDFTVANVSKWHVVLDEDARIDMTFTTPGGKTWTYRGEDFAKKHTVVFQHREASSLDTNGAGKLNTFTVQATFTDVSGNVTNVTNFGSFDATTMLNLGFPVQGVVGDLNFTSEVSNAGGSLDLDIEARVDFKEFGPPALPAAGHVLIGQVLVRNLATDKWETTTNVTTTLPKSFLWTPNDPDPDDMMLPPAVDYTLLPRALQGEFLVLPPTDAAGLTTGSCTVTGLSPGQEVRFVVRIIQEPVADPFDPTYVYDPQNPVFRFPGPPVTYDLPTTPKAFRAIDTTF